MSCVRQDHDGWSVSILFYVDPWKEETGTPVCFAPQKARAEPHGEADHGRACSPDPGVICKKLCIGYHGSLCRVPR